MKPSETIFSGKSLVIPMADVQHFEKEFSDGKCVNPNAPKENELDGIMVITDKTKWNYEHDCWENSIYISNWDGEADKFRKAWCDYRAEIDGMLD